MTQGPARPAPLPPAAAVVAYVAGAALLASAAPLLAYAGSLALFGAPHALAELRYVDGRFGAGLASRRGLAIAGVLAVVVALRALVLLGQAPALDAFVLELGLVALLAFLVVPSLVARPGRAGLAFAVGAAIALGSLLDPLLTVVVLALLHNATPVGFLAERDDVRARALPACAVAFVAVPLAIASGLPSAGLAALGLAAPDAGPASAGTLADHLRVFVPSAWLGSPRAADVFAAAAYLQLLHYGIVLGVLPRLLRTGGDAPVLPWPRAGVLALAIAAVGGAFTVAFLARFTPTRATYGLLASVHAWLEVPVLLLALGGRAAAAGPRGPEGGIA
ncbi:MAG: hypothetical protein JNM10_02960 [Planctomycetia bacterium]|nr:hypothetical protein [Planctomycetia bacterium]